MGTFYSYSCQRAIHLLSDFCLIQVPMNAIGDRMAISPKLHIEVCENVIDCISDICDKHSIQDLAHCARVCRAWVPRAQMHLFSFVYILPIIAPLGIQYALHRKSFLLKNINSFEENYDGMSRPTNSLTAYRVPSLKRCSVYMLYLETAHYRFPSSALSLHALEHSRQCKTKDVNRLC